MIVRRLPFRNVGSTDLTVHVEPWGEQHVLTTDTCLELVFYGPVGGKPEIHVGVSEIFVYGWQESRVFVLKDNVCLSQPSMLKIIDRLTTQEDIDKSRLELDPESLSFAQTFLDSAESWDSAGREAAMIAVSQVAPMLHNLQNSRFVWRFCETVLQSRGVFLQSNSVMHKEFINTYNELGDFVEVLENWHRASKMDSELIDTETPS